MRRWNLRGALGAAFMPVLLAVFWSATGDAKERVALVIGNGAYEHVPSLANRSGELQRQL